MRKESHTLVSALTKYTDTPIFTTMISKQHSKKPRTRSLTILNKAVGLSLFVSMLDKESLRLLLVHYVTLVKVKLASKIIIH